MSQAHHATIDFAPAVSERWERGAFAIAVLVMVLAVWSVPHLSFVDGGVHIAMAHLWAGLVTGTLPPAQAQYYELNLALEPNWFIYPPLAALLAVFTPVTSEKLLLSAFIVAFPYAFRWTITAIRPRNAALAWYGLPFVFSWPLNLGLYNFMWSVVGLFVALGLALRWRREPGRARMAMLAGVTVLTFFAHVTSVVVLTLALGSLVGWRLALESGWIGRGGAEETGMAPALTLASRWGLALSPALVLTLLFALAHTDTEIVYGLDPWYRLKMLLYGNILLSHSRWEAVFAAPLAVLPPIAAIYARRRRDGWVAMDGLLAGAVAVTVFGFLVPNAILGGGLIVQRLQLYPYLLVMAWLAAVTDWPALRRVVVAAGAFGGLGLLVLNLAQYHRDAVHVGEFESVAPRLNPGETVLLLDFTGWNASPDGQAESFRLNFLGHPLSRLIATRGIVDLNLFQASSPNFPVRYRFERDPYIHLRGNGPIAQTPPQDEFLAPETHSAISVDAVLVWGLTPERAAMAGARVPLDQLDQGFHEVWRSAHGWLHLYRRNPASPEFP